jgi:hypothetical protein
MRALQPMGILAVSLTLTAVFLGKKPTLPAR